MASVPRSRFGATIRTGRIARGWTQRQLADRAGVPQSVVSAIETGEGGELATLERVCVALGGELRLEARLPYAGDGSRQLDLGHARCVGTARRLLEASGYDCATEQEVTDGQWRGRIDLLGFDATMRRLVVVEVKTELLDAGGLERQVDRYARLCLDVARRRGWSVAEVSVAVLVLATAEADAFLLANWGGHGRCVPGSRPRCHRLPSRAKAPARPHPADARSVPKGPPRSRSIPRRRSTNASAVSRLPGVRRGDRWKGQLPRRVRRKNPGALHPSLSAVSRAKRGRFVPAQGRRTHGCDRRSAQPIRFGVRERGNAPKVEFGCTPERGQGDSHRLGRYWGAAAIAGGRRHPPGSAALTRASRRPPAPTPPPPRLCSPHAARDVHGRTGPQNRDVRPPAWSPPFPMLVVVDQRVRSTS